MRATATPDAGDPGCVGKPPVTVAGGMILSAGRILLGRRAPHRRICPNTWDLIGGHLERGETAEQALVRELCEEIDAAPRTFRLLAVLDFSAEAQTPLLYALFRVDGLDRSPRLANDEHTDLRWFDLPDAAVLPDLASERYRPFLTSHALELAHERDTHGASRPRTGRTTP